MYTETKLKHLDVILQVEVVSQLLYTPLSLHVDGETT